MQGITVKEALILMKAKGIELVAGAKGLNNEINSVSVLEIILYEEWIRGGELILTTLTAFENVSSIIKTVSDFSKFKVAAVGLHPGNRNALELNSRIIEVADEVGLPLFIIPRDIPYATIFSIIYGAILNKQAILLSKSQEINNYMTHVLIEGGNKKSITDSLSSILKKPVLIIDENLKVIARSSYNKRGEEIFKSYDNGELDKTISLVKTAKIDGMIDDFRNTISYKVKIGNTIYNQIVKRVDIDRIEYNYIIIWEDLIADEYEINHDMLGLLNAATTLALYQLKEKAIIDTERKLKIDFYDDLLNRNFESEDAIIKRANSLGLSINNIPQVFIVDIDNFEGYYIRNLDKGELHIQNIKSSLNKIVSFAVKTKNKDSIVISKSDSFIVLLHFNKGAKKEIVKQTILSIISQIQDELTKRIPEITVSYGIGNYISSLIDLSKSYRTASEVIKIGRKVYGNNKVIFYSELGIYSFLVSDNYDEFRNKCENEINRLKKILESKDETLVDTLETYLDSNESVSITSEKLFLHPNTVRYRIRQIKAILGPGVFDRYEERLKIHIALKMRKISSLL